MKNLNENKAQLSSSQIFKKKLFSSFRATNTEIKDDFYSREGSSSRKSSEDINSQLNSPLKGIFIKDFIYFMCLDSFTKETHSSK